VIFENNWVLWTVVIVSALLGTFFLFMQLQQDQYQWITADGYKIQSIPKDATIVFVNNNEKGLVSYTKRED